MVKLMHRQVTSPASHLQTTRSARPHTLPPWAVMAALVNVDRTQLVVLQVLGDHLPHGGARPIYEKSTRLTRLTLEPDAVQI